MAFQHIDRQVLRMIAKIFKDYPSPEKRYLERFFKGHENTKPEHSANKRWHTNVDIDFKFAPSVRPYNAAENIRLKPVKVKAKEYHDAYDDKAVAKEYGKLAAKARVCHAWQEAGREVTGSTWRGRGVITD